MQLTTSSGNRLMYKLQVRAAAITSTFFAVIAFSSGSSPSALWRIDSH